MGDRYIGGNFFKVVDIKELEQGYARITLENQYVRTNDIVLVLSFNKLPSVGGKVQLDMLST